MLGQNAQSNQRWQLTTMAASACRHGWASGALSSQFEAIGMKDARFNAMQDVLKETSLAVNAMQDVVKETSLAVHTSNRREDRM